MVNQDKERQIKRGSVTRIADKSGLNFHWSARSQRHPIRLGHITHWCAMLIFKCNYWWLNVTSDAWRLTDDLIQTPLISPTHSHIFHVGSLLSSNSTAFSAKTERKLSQRGLQLCITKKPNAKVSARQPWYIERSSLNRPHLGTPSNIQRIGLIYRPTSLKSILSVRNNSLADSASLSSFV